MIVRHAMTPINWTLVIENLVWITCQLNLGWLGILHYLFKFCRIQKVRKMRIIFSCNADMYCKL